MYILDANHISSSLSADVIQREPIPVSHSTQQISILTQLTPWLAQSWKPTSSHALLLNFGVNNCVWGALNALRGGGGSASGGWDCNIYLEDETSNPVANHAVEMPSYGHTFHCKCITQWFDRRSTCLMCRWDLSMYLDPAVQRFLSHFTEEDYWLSSLFFVV